MDNPKQNNWKGKVIAQSGSQYNLETFCDRRNSNQHNSETQNTQISKVEGRKRKESTVLH